MTLLIGRACVPLYNDATNEIPYRKRDTHANYLVLCKEYIFKIRTLQFALLFLSKRVARRSMLFFVVNARGLSRLLLTLQLSASVPRGRDA